MFEYRVTKYDPADRNRQGSYRGGEWYLYAHIGNYFKGVVLTEAEYFRVECAYVVTAVAFMQEAGIAMLTVRGLENNRGAEIAFAEGSVLPLGAVAAVLGRVLREEIWCRLEHPLGFVHVGWDYYMYVGVPVDCPMAREQAQALGLFVEPFQSPYRERERAL